MPSRAHDSALAAGQSPFAIVLACSDSRVPVEFVFDQGFGDLFVIRVAGNIVAPTQIGSIEYAAGTVRHAAGRGSGTQQLRRCRCHAR